MIKCNLAQADVPCVMDSTNQPKPADVHPSIIERSSSSPMDNIAISASDLIEMIKSGQSNDVNELIRQMLNDRLAA